MTRRHRSAQTMAVVALLGFASGAPADSPRQSLVIRVEPTGACTTRLVPDERAAAGLTAEIERGPAITPLPFSVAVRLRNESGVVAYHPTIHVLRLHDLPVSARAMPELDLTLPGGARGLLPDRAVADRLRLPEGKGRLAVQFLLRPGVAPRLVRVIGGPGTTPGRFNKPRGIQPLPDGRLIVADRGNNRVQLLDPMGTALATWGAFGAEPGLFDHPEDVAVDPHTGEVFVCDMNNARVQVFTGTGKFLRILDGHAGGGFNHPVDIAIDPARGVLYVGDAGNFRVARLRFDGTWLSAWGSFGTAPGQFGAILDVEVASDGRVLVTDGAQRRAQIFEPDGTFVGELSTVTTPAAGIRYPSAIVGVGAAGILVADFAQDRVMALARDGAYLGEFGRDSDSPGGMRYPSDLRLVGSVLHVCETASDNVTAFELEGWEPFESLRAGRAEATQRNRVMAEPSARRLAR